METELKKDVGKYRLLYFQPNPEDGERVCVGLLFEERRSRSVVYDDKFQKVRCIAPSYEPELMKFYLDDLDSTLQNSEDDLTLILRRYGPQLVASEERLVSLPLTDTTRFSLLERFVARGGRPTAELTAVVAKAPSSDEFGERIRKYVQQYVRPTDVRIIPNARPRDLFDYPLPDLRPVALAIRKPGKTILIDGVDLRISGNNKRWIEPTGSRIHSGSTDESDPKTSLSCKRPSAELASCLTARLAEPRPITRRMISPCISSKKKQT